ncbi:MAG: hemoglobin [Bradymonadia bacterium]|jgi:hemoglobin
MSHFDRLGADRLRTILTDFYDRVFADPMIGFFFVGKDQARLVELEWQLTARILGAKVPYAGRGMGAAHRKLPIMRGHFLRRNKLLEDVLDAHAVEDDIRQAWMKHARDAERAIIGNRPRGPHCDADQITPETGLRVHNGGEQ